MTSPLHQIHFTSIAPPGLVDDIVESYRLAAQELGYATTFAPSRSVPGVLNIVFFCWSLRWATLVDLHPQCIVVNFEHLHEKSRYLLPGYREILEHAYVWEYSETNFHRHKALNVFAADYVPLGYQQGAEFELPVEMVLPDEQRDIDVFFVGQVNARRLQTLQQLQSYGLHVVSGSFPPEERDAYLRRSKVALNLHQFDDSRIVEIPRLSMLFRNRKAVVCELYPDSELAPEWRDAVAGATYDGLVDATLSLLKDHARRVELERLGYERFTQRPQKAFVAAALTRFTQWLSQQPQGNSAASPESRTRGRMTVVLTAETEHASEWGQTIASMIQQDQAAFDLIVIAASAPPIAALASLASVRRLHLPSPIARASARNLGLAQADGEYVVFTQTGEIWAPERLQRQSEFLNAHPEIDIVGSWLGSSGSGTNSHKMAELDDEIKAEFLKFGGGLALCTCMFRQSFLRQHGLRFDAQFDSHNESHFLYRCVVADANFAVIPAVLCDRNTAVALDFIPVESDNQLSKQARHELLTAYFPGLTVQETWHLGELYSSHWPAESDFATRLLDLLVKASESLSNKVNLSPAAVRRALRHEAVRLVNLFSQAGLVDSAWLEAQFEFPDKANFLAPARSELQGLP